MRAILPRAGLDWASAWTAVTTFLASRRRGHPVHQSYRPSVISDEHPMAKLTLGKLSGTLMMLSCAFYAEARAAAGPHLACSGTLTIASESQDSVQEQPWNFLLTIDSDKYEVTINDASIPIISDASEPVIGFKDDPTADASLDGFWGSFDTVTRKINIHVIAGTIFTGTCQPEQ
jgi:hypothetical protein